MKKDMCDIEEYTVVIHERVRGQIKEIVDYIESVSTKSHARRYADELETNFYSLSNPILVHAMQPSQWQVAKKYHRNAKRLITKNRKWNIIFHTYGKYVIVDAIIPSTLMK